MFNEVINKCSVKASIFDLKIENEELYIKMKEDLDVDLLVFKNSKVYEKIYKEIYEKDPEIYALYTSCHNYLINLGITLSDTEYWNKNGNK